MQEWVDLKNYSDLGKAEGDYLHYWDHRLTVTCEEKTYRNRYKFCALSLKEYNSCTCL